jgi:DNA-binding transcriptional LysR family regulator
VLEMLAEVGAQRTRTDITVIGEAMIVLRMLSEGKHLAVLPRYPLRVMSRWFPVVELALDAEPKPRTLHLWYRAAMAEDRVMNAVMETIRAHAARAA